MNVSYQEIKKAATKAGIDTTNWTLEMTGGGCATIYIFKDEDHTVEWPHLLIGPGSIHADKQFTFDELFIGPGHEDDMEHGDEAKDFESLFAAYNKWFAYATEMNRPQS